MGLTQTKTKKERAQLEIENKETQETQNNEETTEENQDKNNGQLGHRLPYVLDKETRSGCV